MWCIIDWLSRLTFRLVTVVVSVPFGGYFFNIRSTNSEISIETRLKDVSNWPEYIWQNTYFFTPYTHSFPDIFSTFCFDSVVSLAAKGIACSKNQWIDSTKFQHTFSRIEAWWYIFSSAELPTMAASLNWKVGAVKAITKVRESTLENEAIYNLIESRSLGFGVTHTY